MVEIFFLNFDARDPL